MELKFIEVAFCLDTDWEKDPKYTRVIESWGDSLIAPQKGDSVILDDEGNRGYYEVVHREFHNEASVTCVVKFVKKYYE